MTVLILGGTGQVGRHLRALLPDALYVDRTNLDLDKPDTVEAEIATRSPSFIINAAAFTAVDGAETQAATAQRINAESVAALARSAAALDVPLLHVSTDFVFDGNTDGPYSVTDATAPVNVYGATKLAGELAVGSISRRYWILRTSWVFSEYGSNFVKTMLRLAGSVTELSVVDDQRGCPTYAGDLARLIARFAGSPQPLVPYGTYHATGGPATTWYGFACTIFARAVATGALSRAPTVHPITTAEYPTPAGRPMNSVLEPSPALGTVFDWRAGLDKVLLNVE